MTGQAHLNTGFLRAGIVAGHGGILDQAGAAWAAAEQAAYDEWQAAMYAAESTYTQTESQAWNQYLERLDELNSQLEHTRQILEAAFQTAWNNALRDWTEMETEAWDAYQRARAQMLRQPPEGERQASPAPVEASNLLAMQVAPRKRSDRLLTHSHDLEFADKVLGRWADWAWSKVFPNPTQQVTNWLQQLRRSKDLNDYFRVLGNGAAHILGMPLHTTQFFVLATALDNLRYGKREYRPVLSTSAGIKEDKPYLREVKLRSEVQNYSFDLSGIGGLNVGKVSFKLQATNQPDGILDLYGNGEDAIRVTGVVHYKLEVQFSTVSFNSSCDQRWDLAYLGGVIPDVTSGFGFNFQ